jgi:hypothetical protein
MLDDADDDPAEQVDRHDHDAGHRVALHELRGAVHRAVEVRFARDLAPALARLRLGDLPRVEVGVDRHLLAGHRVEREARRDLGDPARAVRDHDELDHDEDQEDDEPDHKVAADDERAERVDDAAGLAVHEHEPGDADVDREPEERRQEQQRREGGEVEGPPHDHRRRDDRERPGDVHRDQQADQRRGQRHDHHEDDEDDTGNAGEIAVPQDAGCELVHGSTKR